MGRAATRGRPAVARPRPVRPGRGGSLRARGRDRADAALRPLRDRSALLPPLPRGARELRPDRVVLLVYERARSAPSLRASCGVDGAHLPARRRCGCAPHDGRRLRAGRGADPLELHPDDRPSRLPGRPARLRHLRAARRARSEAPRRDLENRAAAPAGRRRRGSSGRRRARPRCDHLHDLVAPPDAGTRKWRPLRASLLGGRPRPPARDRPRDALGVDRAAHAASRRAAAQRGVGASALHADARPVALLTASRARGHLERRLPLGAHRAHAVGDLPVRRDLPRAPRARARARSTRGTSRRHLEARSRFRRVRHERGAHRRGVRPRRDDPRLDDDGAGSLPRFGRRRHGRLHGGHSGAPRGLRRAARIDALAPPRGPPADSLRRGHGLLRGGLRPRRCARNGTQGVRRRAGDAERRGERGPHDHGNRRLRGGGGRNPLPRPRHRGLEKHFE